MSGLFLFTYIINSLTYFLGKQIGNLQQKALKFKFSHIISHSLILVLAIQILNLSVNSIDFKPQQTADISEFNDINSIAEYVCEIVLGHANAFPEPSQKEQKQSQLQKYAAYKILTASLYLVDPPSIKAPIQFNACYDRSYYYQFFQEINPPPPKA